MSDNIKQGPFTRGGTMLIIYRPSHDKRRDLQRFLTEQCSDNHLVNLARSIDDLKRMIHRQKMRLSLNEITVVFDWRLISLAERHLYQNTTLLLAQQLRTETSVRNLLICDETTPQDLSNIDGKIPHQYSEQKLRELILEYIKQKGSLNTCFKKIRWL